MCAMCYDINIIFRHGSLLGFHYMMRIITYDRLVPSNAVRVPLVIGLNFCCQHGKVFLGR